MTYIYLVGKERIYVDSFAVHPFKVSKLVQFLDPYNQIVIPDAQRTGIRLVTKSFEKKEENKMSCHSI